MENRRPRNERDHQRSETDGPTIVHPREKRANDERLHREITTTLLGHQTSRRGSLRMPNIRFLGDSEARRTHRPKPPGLRSQYSCQKVKLGEKRRPRRTRNNHDTRTRNEGQSHSRGKPLLGPTRRQQRPEKCLIATPRNKQPRRKFPPIRIPEQGGENDTANQDDIPETIDGSG